MRIKHAIINVMEYITLLDLNSANRLRAYSQGAMGCKSRSHEAIASYIDMAFFSLSVSL